MALQLGSQKIELFIKCLKLKDLDTFSKSDPQCFVYMMMNNAWAKIGETELIMNNLNPEFKTSIKTTYTFEVAQNIKFEVIDYDSPGNHDLIGTVETTIGAIMGKGSAPWTGELKVNNNAKGRGTIIINTESLVTSNNQIAWQIAAQGLRNRAGGCMGMCDEIQPVKYQVWRANSENQQQFNCVYNSMVAHNTQTPTFQMVRIPLTTVCNAQLELPIKIVFVCQNREIGHFITSVAELQNQRNHNLVGPNNQPAGSVTFRQFQVIERPTFVECLRSGWQLSLAVAIDFTASNGAITTPNSLHAMNQFNQYEQAIQQVGAILEPYSNDKQFPTFGFGGIPTHMGLPGVSHCFSLNGNPQNPNIFGIQGILQTYRQVLPQIQLSGPTYFGDVIQAFNSYTQQTQGQQKYNVLLILTDGTIHDMARTRELVVQASHMAASIIIVGVGNAEFGMMEQLDSDEQLLKAPSGATAKRDIVQFVEFRECVKRGNLATEVLKEVPEQVTGFCESIGWKPNAMTNMMSKGLGGTLAGVAAGLGVNMNQQQQQI